MAADVYTTDSQRGRGGWTWYTGSASWMYRVGLESILGFVKRGNTLRIDPRVPASWSEYSIDYRFGETLYAITVRAGKAGSPLRVSMDGVELVSLEILLVDDGRRREIVVLRPT